MLVSLASVAMLGGIVVGSTQAFAAFPDTAVKVKFNADLTPPTTDPTALELRAIPTHADFGSMEVGAGHTASATVQGSGYVKVHDGRAAGQAWEVTAAASTLVSGSDVIDDAEITINSAAPVLDWTAGTNPTDPGTLGSATTAVTVARPGTVLTTDGTTKAFANTTSSDTQGFAIPVDGMDIMVPDAPTSYANKEFSGTITWTLNNTIMQ
ncbi:WxL domain-containing protein [Enterococcus sp. 669A]|uniref:WxL domain-containing protein n=1 Tax=Candidatus Enterococcus moelleringii TaxID=2815325 RepID=A0ABS3LB81_9ENTE|nr:WxL domain-containing protein [Enterococcus sp. 669A]MBO1306894.1 WxL domain-containing protein [Enterococcus sp. 669A]